MLSPEDFYASEMVGKTIDRPPPDSTPRCTASTSSGIRRWQGLKSLAEVAIPTTAEQPADLPVDQAKPQAQVTGERGVTVTSQAVVEPAFRRHRGALGIVGVLGPGAWRLSRSAAARGAIDAELIAVSEVRQRLLEGGQRQRRGDQS